MQTLKGRVFKTQWEARKAIVKAIWNHPRCTPRLVLTILFTRNDQKWLTIARGFGIIVLED